MKNTACRPKIIVSADGSGIVSQAELTAAGAADDQAMVAATQALMQLVDAAGSAVGKYWVVMHGSQRVQVGEHNIQHPDAPPNASVGKPPHLVTPIGSRPAHIQEVHDA